MLGLAKDKDEALLTKNWDWGTQTFSQRRIRRIEGCREAKTKRCYSSSQGAKSVGSQGKIGFWAAAKASKKGT